METGSNWFSFTPDPDDAEWLIYAPKDETRYNAVLGQLAVRRDGDRGIVRLKPHRALTNMQDRLHGGALLGFIDAAIFPAATILGSLGAPNGVTVDVSAQFVGAADAERPIDAIVEISRETRRMIFLRGTVEQSGDMVMSFLAIIRKATR